MPNLANITISDRELTPVAHTFSPEGEKDGIATFVESGNSLVGNNTLTVSSRDTGKYVKARVRTDMPIVQVETINGIDNDRVVRRLTADTTITLPKSSTLQERKNIIGIHMGAMAADQTDVDKVLTAVEKWF